MQLQVTSRHNSNEVRVLNVTCSTSYLAPINKFPKTEIFIPIYFTCTSET